MSDGRSKNKDMPLTDQMKACVDYYLSHLPYNQTAAYNAIYPSQGRSQRTLQTAASRFFHNPRVMKYKEERLQEIYDEANINAQTIALRLAQVAFDNRDENTSSALKAIDLLQKQLGLQNKNINLDADINAAVQIIEDIDIES